MYQCLNCFPIIESQSIVPTNYFSTMSVPQVHKTTYKAFTKRQNKHSRYDNINVLTSPSDSGTTTRGASCSLMRAGSSIMKIFKGVRNHVPTLLDSSHVLLSDFVSLCTHAPTCLHLNLTNVMATTFRS